MAGMRSSVALMAGLAGVWAASSARADDFAFSFVGTTMQASGFVSAVTNGTGSLSAVAGSLDIALGGAAGGYSLLPNPSATAPYLSPSGFFIVDNRVDMSGPQPISWYGLLFTNEGGVEVNIWSNGAGSPYTLYVHGPGVSFQDQGEFSINLRLPRGTSYPRTEAFIAPIEKEVLALPSLRRAMTNISPGSARTTTLHIEAEVHDVAVVHDVVLAFQPHLAGLLCSLLTLAGNEIVEGNHFGADEPMFEVGMDDAGRLGRGRADRDGPGAHFLRPRGEVGLQAEQLVRRVDHAVEAGLREAEVVEVDLAASLDRAVGVCRGSADGGAASCGGDGCGVGGGGSDRV